jgi:hypothetical protein
MALSATVLPVVGPSRARSTEETETEEDRREQKREAHQACGSTPGAVHKKYDGSNNMTDFFTGHLSTSAVFLAKESLRFRSLFKDACVR